MSDETNGASASNPMTAARRNAAPPRLKRFFAQASVEARDGAFHLALDGRHARTPAKRPLAVRSRKLAEALAAEWQAQGEWIEPALMPVTRIVNSAIDGIADQREAVIDDIAKYAGSDLVCYRAAQPEELAAAQQAAWDPLLAFVDVMLGARLRTGDGIAHVAQDPTALQALRARVVAVADLSALGALHVLTTLTGSLVVALATTEGHLDVDDAWAAAHVDERFQEQRWGIDDDAARREAGRLVEFRAAAMVFALATSGGEPVSRPQEIP